MEAVDGFTVTPRQIYIQSTSESVIWYSVQAKLQQTSTSYSSLFFSSHKSKISDTSKSSVLLVITSTPGAFMSPAMTVANHASVHPSPPAALGKVCRIEQISATDRELRA